MKVATFLDPLSSCQAAVISIRNPVYADKMVEIELEVFLSVNGKTAARSWIESYARPVKGVWDAYGIQIRSPPRLYEPNS